MRFSKRTALSAFIPIWGDESLHLIFGWPVNPLNRVRKELPHKTLTNSEDRKQISLCLRAVWAPWMLWILLLSFFHTFWGHVPQFNPAWGRTALRTFTSAVLWGFFRPGVRSLIFQLKFTFSILCFRAFIARNVSVQFFGFSVLFCELIFDLKFDFRFFDLVFYFRFCRAFNSLNWKRTVFRIFIPVVLWTAFEFEVRFSISQFVFFYCVFNMQAIIGRWDLCYLIEIYQVGALAEYFDGGLESWARHRSLY